MEEGIVREPVRFTGRDGTTKLHGSIWFDLDNARAYGTDERCGKAFCEKCE